MIVFLSLLLLFQESEVPFKAGDEYEVKIDIQFRQLIKSGETKVDLQSVDDPKGKRTGGLVPYLVLSVKMLKLSEDEVKVKIIDQTGLTHSTKKVEVGAPFKVDMGAIQDIKDGSVPGEYNFVLISPKKKRTSRIEVRVEKNGAYYVNGVVCGKF